MANLVYILCALTSLACALLLLRAFQQTKRVLLGWSGFCFAALAVSNILLVVDRLVVPDIDLMVWRSLVSLIALLSLLYGLIFEAS